MTHVPTGSPDDLRLVGMAEITDMTGMTRQAVSNLRSRDGAFPAPLAELRSGPVFREADITAYLSSRGRQVQPAAYTAAYLSSRSRQVQPAANGAVQAKWVPFNPLDRLNLASSVERALLEEPFYKFPPAGPFSGAGLYCIYYMGDYGPYAEMGAANRAAERDETTPAIPIYVGRAIPRGARAGVGGLLSTVEEPVLFHRLREHGKSLEQVEQHAKTTGEDNLRATDFRFRFLIVEDIWVPLAEALLIGHFQPLWNQVISGFGNHDPGGGRRAGARPDWDELHPGRPWALKQAPARRSQSECLDKVREHLSTLPEPDLGSPPALTDDVLQHLDQDD